MAGMLGAASVGQAQTRSLPGVPAVPPPAAATALPGVPTLPESLGAASSAPKPVAVAVKTPAPPKVPVQPVPSWPGVAANRNPAGGDSFSVHSADHQAYFRVVLRGAGLESARVVRRQNGIRVIFRVPQTVNRARLLAGLPGWMLPAGLSADSRFLDISLPKDCVPHSHLYPGGRLAIDIAGAAKFVAAEARKPRPVPMPRQIEAATPAAAKPPKAKRPRPVAVAAHRTAAPGQTLTIAVYKAPPPLTPRASLIADGLSLRFDFPAATAAAVFPLDGAIWVVFDRAAALDLSGLAAGDGADAISAQQVATSTGTVVRIAVPRGVYASVGGIDNSWIVDLHSEKRAGDFAPQFVPPQAEGDAVVFAVGSPVAPVGFAEAGRGDLFLVVPAGIAGPGVPAKIQLPHGAVLKSYQGLVMLPSSDDFSASLVPGGVEVR